MTKKKSRRRKKNNSEAFEVVEDAYDSATGSWEGWDWTHDPGGIHAEGPGALDDWDAWERERVAELADVRDWSDPDGGSYTPHRADQVAAAEREYGEGAQEAAASAEASAREALDAARKGDWPEALSAAKQAASYESDYGDDPTWRPLVRAVEKAHQAMRPKANPNTALIKSRCMRG